MDAKLPDIAIAEHLAERIAAVDAGKLPAAAREKCEQTLVDVVGLCIAARNEDYVGSALAGWDVPGIGVAGDYVGIWLETLVEQITPNTFISFGGLAAASIGASAGSVITLPFDGSIDYCVTKSFHLRGK